MQAGAEQDDRGDRPDAPDRPDDVGTANSRPDDGIRTTKLALSRNEGEAVRVYGPAKIKVVRARGGRVRLCVEAESDVLVLREELVDSEPDRPEPQPPPNTRAA